MDPNLLVYGRSTPPSLPLALRAGPLTLEFDPASGAIRYLELPDGTEAVRAVYATLRRGDWSTVTPDVSELQIETSEDGFAISFRLAYAVGHAATVRIEGGPEGIVYAYEGVAERPFETSRTGLCVLHPGAFADQPVEIRHPDGTRESGRFPDLVQPDWPFREVVGVSVKLPGYKVETSLEGETFEMEDQRNWGDASFKTYCYPQSRPFPYAVAQGQRIAQTVRIVAKPWGSKVEGLPPLPDGMAGVLFIEETLPVPMIGLVAGEEPSAEAVAAAPADYLRMPARAARELGRPLELVVSPDDDSEGVLERIRSLPEPPDRVVLPLRRAADAPRFKAALGEEVSIVIEGDALVDLNRSPLDFKEAGGLGFGYHPQSHLFDDRTLFENVESLPDLAATVAERTEGLIVAGPIRLGPAGDARSGSLLGAAWLVAALASLVRSDVDVMTLLDLEGPDGLFREGRVIPSYHVLADLHEFADGDLIVGLGTGRRAAGFAIVLDESFRAIVANLTPQPLTLSVVAAGDGPHVVKVLDERNVERATTAPAAWREEAGEAIEPDEGTITIDLGPYGVARIDADVEPLDEEGED